MNRLLCLLIFCLALASCQRELHFDDPGQGSAQYTLKGNPATCAAVAVTGQYLVAHDVGAGNTAVVEVRVASPGSYRIVTDTVNGISFSAKGNLDKVTDSTTISLKATGKPIAMGTYSFTIAGATSVCQFSVTVDSAYDNNGVLTCKIDGVQKDFSYNASAITQNPDGGSFLLCKGATLRWGNGTAETLQFYAGLRSGHPIPPGTYDTKGYGGPSIPNPYEIGINFMLNNANGSATTWATSSDIIVVNPGFSITISTLTATRATGTFSGQVTDIYAGRNTTRNITDGVYNLPVH